MMTPEEIADLLVKLDKAWTPDYPGALISDAIAAIEQLSAAKES